MQTMSMQYYKIFTRQKNVQFIQSIYILKFLILTNKKVNVQYTPN
jgi:hypothetical protein